MPPVLLFRETFDGESGTINAKDRVPVPGPGGAPEYQGADDRYRVHATGYSDAKSTLSDPESVARWPYTIPVGTRFRIVMDVYREGVDHVGGGLNGKVYCPAEDIATWDFLDCLSGDIRRNSLVLTDFTLTWLKPTSAPPPATQTVAFAGSIAHPPDTGVRYEFEVDESGLTGAVYAAVFGVDRPTFGTPEDIAPLSSGPLPEELAAHLTADRRIGWWGRRAASGLVGFRLYNFEVWDMGTPVALTGPPCTLLLTVYDDDGVTPLWEVATDPNHARPYLVEPEHYGEREIDVATGSASLGSVTWTAIDLPLLAGDQDGGYLTALLAEIGVPDLAGHRIRFLRFDPNGDPVIIVDGPAGAPRLNPDYASFSGDIRDTGETERKIRLFDLVRSGAPVISGATPAGPEEAGTDYDFEWDVVVNP